MENALDVVMHPIRMRILMTLAGRQLTALQIAEALGDVAQATLYRHLGRLHRAGVLRIAAERQVRGTVEKLYGVNEEYAGMSPERLAEVGPEDHRRYFATFVASLLDDFARYTKGAEHLDLLADGVGYRKFPLELSDAEFAALTAKMNEVIKPYFENKPAAGRTRRIFATIVLPDRAAAAARPPRAEIETDDLPPRERPEETT